MAGLISQETIEQVRAGSDIIDVVGSYFPLKRSGANFMALCPFHKEKTPSFNVHPGKQIVRATAHRCISSVRLDSQSGSSLSKSKNKVDRRARLDADTCRRTGCSPSLSRVQMVMIKLTAYFIGFSTL